jgi:hypothetical protein
MKSKLWLLFGFAIVIAANASAWWLGASLGTHIGLGMASIIMVIRLSIQWTRIQLLESLMHLDAEDQERIIETLDTEDRELVRRVLRRSEIDDSNDKIRNA